jgi:hypothetical protein
MSKEDPALSPEVVASDDSTTNPPVVDEETESEEPKGTEESVQEEVQKPQDDQEPVPEVELTIEGEEPPPEKEAAPSWVKDLRREHRELKARNAELERTLKAQSQPAVVDLGPKPTLEGCDFDPRVFEQKLESWRDQKQEADRQAATARVAAETQQREWNDKLQAYGRER